MRASRTRRPHQQRQAVSAVAAATGGVAPARCSWTRITIAKASASTAAAGSSSTSGLDRVLSRFRPEPATDDWVADLGGFARAHRRLLTAHPWAVAPLFTQPNPGMSAIRIGELALAILRRGGLSNARAVAAFSGIIALNYGWSSFTAARDLDPDGPSHDVGAALAGLPRSEFPLTVAVAGEMGAYGSDEHYDFVLAQLLAGLRSATAS